MYNKKEQDDIRNSLRLIHQATQFKNTEEAHKSNGDIDLSAYAEQFATITIFADRCLSDPRSWTIRKSYSDCGAPIPRSLAESYFHNLCNLLKKKLTNKIFGDTKMIEIALKIMFCAQKSSKIVLDFYFTQNLDNFVVGFQSR